MRLSPTVLAVVASATSLFAQSDQCTSATPIVGNGSFPFTTIGATNGGQIGSCNDVTTGDSSDAWFAWTPITSGTHLLRICTTDYDAVISMRTACGGVELACEDGSGCGPSLDNVDILVPGLSAGSTYLVQVDGWRGASGSGVLDISPFSAPPDECIAPAVIQGTGAFEFTTVAATDSGTPPSCSQAAVNPDVWFRWTPAVDGDYVLSACGASYDAILTAYDDCGGNEIACSESNGCAFVGFNFAQVQLPNATAGTPYVVQLAGWNTVGSGLLDISPVSDAPLGGVYCDSLPNSTGAVAKLFAMGSASVSASALTLRATDLPPAVTGRFYFGTNQTAQPFGEGIRCVTGQTQRLPILVTTAQGFLVEPNAFNHPTPYLPITAGATLNFQAWYRDPSGGASGFNLSDARTLTFSP